VLQLLGGGAVVAANLRLHPVDVLVPPLLHTQVGSFCVEHEPARERIVRHGLGQVVLVQVAAGEKPDPKAQFRAR
jgi:hypothetical protein